MKTCPTTVDLVLGFLALGFTGLWVAACICYAHCRGDAEIGISDTQGREPAGDDQGTPLNH